MMYQEKATILSTEAVAQDIYLLRFTAPKIAAAAQPGQMVSVRISESMVPLLRRPFAVFEADAKAGMAAILFEVVGSGTRLLSKKREGEVFDIIGPTGHGFPTEDNPYKTMLAVAGGIGFAPLHFLCRQMEKKGVQTYLFYGAQHAKNIVKQSYSEKVTVMYSTDDGSYGFGGFVTDLLEQKTDLFPGGSVVSACGPLVMMRQVWKLAREHLWLCHVSLEQFMACGVGACNGCVVDCKAAGDKVVRKRVCKDGPVFKAEELVWK